MNNQSNNSKQNSLQTEMQSSQNSNQTNSQSSQSSLNPQPVPAAVEYADSKPAKKRGVPKGVIIGIVAVLVIAAIAVAVFFGLKFFNKKKKPAPAPQPTLIQKSGDGTVTTLAFYPTTDASKSDLSKAADIMKKRVEVLGEGFEISSDKEKITLTIENNLLGSTALERAMTADLISSRGNLYYGDYYSASYEISYDGVESLSVEEVDKDDFISEYVTDFDEDRYEQLKNISSEKIQAIKFTLTDDFAEDFQEKMDDHFEWYDTVCFYHDVLPENASDCVFLGTALFEDKDDVSTFYLVSPGATYEKYPELLEKVFEEDELPTGFVTKLMDEPNWESDEKKFGDNQVAKLDGKAIVVKCTPDEFTLDYTSEVDLEKFKQVIKDRMDYLDTDYMFGVTGFDNKTMCLKVSPEALGPDFVRMIFSTRQVSVYSAFDQISTFSGIELIEGDKFGLKTSTYQTYDEIMAEYNIPNGSVYLVVNDVTVATADISTMNEDGELIFDNFLCIDSAEATEDDEPILNLIASIYDEGYVSFDGTFEVEYFDGDEQLDYDDIDWKYSSKSKIDNDVAEIIEDMGHESSKTLDERNMLTVTLDIDVDENLPVNFLEEVKRVYYSCNFDGGAYNKIHFVIKDEKKNSPADEFRVEIEKDSKMIAYYWVSGPTFDEYFLSSCDLKEADPFFIEHAYDYTW